MQSSRSNGNMAIAAVMQVVIVEVLEERGGEGDEQGTT